MHNIKSCNYKILYLRCTSKNKVKIQVKSLNKISRKNSLLLSMCNGLFIFYRRYEINFTCLNFFRWNPLGIDLLTVLLYSYTVILLFIIEVQDN